MNIRAARPDEAARVCAFYDAVIDHLQGAQFSPGWEKDIYPDGDMLRGFVQRGQMYIGIQDASIACGAVFSPDARDAAALEIHLLAVHPNFTGRGYGRALVNLAREIACAAGAKTIRLDVTQGNLPAEKLYQSMGFCFVKCRRDYFAPDDYMDFREYELHI